MGTLALAEPNEPFEIVRLWLADDGTIDVIACLKPEPVDIADKPRLVLCLGASESMRWMYGGTTASDSRPNLMQLAARRLGAIACGIARYEKVTMVYWAAGPGGSQTEEIGEFDETGCRAVLIGGPGAHAMGDGTRLLPAIRYVVEDVCDGAGQTVGVIITDGIIEDEEACVDYCRKLGEPLVARGQAKGLKLELMAVGPEVDEDQLMRFEDMFEGTPLANAVDIWSYESLAVKLEDVEDVINERFGRLEWQIEEAERDAMADTVVAASGSVLDGKGNEVERFEPLTGLIRFVLPAGSTSFTIRTPNGEVSQDITEALKP